MAAGRPRRAGDRCLSRAGGTVRPRTARRPAPTSSPPPAVPTVSTSCSRSTAETGYRPSPATSPTRVTGRLSWKVRRHGRLDVLVNNAGTCDDGPLGQQSLDDLRRVVEVNLISVMDLCRLAADLLRNAPAASVINVASMYGIVASRSPMAAYNATKAALINPSPAPRCGLGPGRRAGQCPRAWLLPHRAERVPGRPAFAQSIRDRTLLGRTPEPDELDGPLLFLATDASSYMTGQALVIDGGWTAV